MARNIWAGLDIGVETTSICIIDDHGQVLQEATCPTNLQAIHEELRWLKRRRHARIGMEAAGAANIARGLRTLGYSIDLYETRQLSKFLRVRRNKTDAGDASGIAEAGRLGGSLLAKVHLKSLDCQSLQSRLTIRTHLVRNRVAAVNLLGRQIELFGGRIARHCAHSLQFRKKVEPEIRRLFPRSFNPIAGDLLYLLDHCERLVRYQADMDNELRLIALRNETCSRFMAIPGVGPLCALTFYATVDDPHRFRRSSDVGCYLGLTPRLHQSGLTSRIGRISKMGNRSARSLLVQAAIRFMSSSNADANLRSWTLAIEQRSGRKKARIALARKLGVMMLAMWRTGEPYNPAMAIAGQDLLTDNGNEPNPEIRKTPTRAARILRSAQPVQPSQLVHGTS